MEIEYSLRVDPDDFDEFEPGGARGGGGGGGRKKEKHQGDLTMHEHAKQMRQNQAENTVNRAENSDKSPTAEVQDVLEYIKAQDAGSAEMKCLTGYLDWLKENIHNPDDMVVKEGEMSNWEKLTASVKAGGGGRQTSRNARARTHLLTGIRATAEESRQAYPNETIVMKKIRERLQKHLKNWKVVLSASQTDEDRLNQAPVDIEVLEEEVLKRLAA